MNNKDIVVIFNPRILNIIYLSITLIAKYLIGNPEVHVTLI